MHLIFEIISFFLITLLTCEIILLIAIGAFQLRSIATVNHSIDFDLVNGSKFRQCGRQFDIEIDITVLVYNCVGIVVCYDQLKVVIVCRSWWFYCNINSTTILQGILGDQYVCRSCRL